MTTPPTKEAIDKVNLHAYTRFKYRPDRETKSRNSEEREEEWRGGKATMKENVRTKLILWFYE